MNRKKWLCALGLLALCFTGLAEDGKKVLQLSSKDIDTALKTFTEIRQLHHQFSPTDLTFLQATAAIKEVETVLKKNYGDSELFSQHLAAIAGALAHLQSENLLKQLQDVPKKDLPAAAIALFKEQENNFRKVIEDQRKELSDETLAAVKARQDEIMKIFEMPDDDDDDDDDDD